MNKVLAIFKIYGEGDDLVVYDLLDISSNLDTAIDLCLENFETEYLSIPFFPIHQDMNTEQPYIISSRENLPLDQDNDTFGGYLIEEIEVKK